MSTSNTILVGAFLVGIIGLFLYSNYVSSNKLSITSQVGNEFDELFKGVAHEGNNTNVTSQFTENGPPVMLPWGLGMMPVGPSITLY